MDDGDGTRARKRAHECPVSLPATGTRNQLRGPGVTSEVARREIPAAESVSANRSWWDGQAADYYAEHGAFLGDVGFIWGPEGWTEAELDVLALRPGLRVLEIGGGAGQCARGVQQAYGGQVASSDLSLGMLRTGQSIDAATERRLPLLQVDGRALPFASASMDRVFTAYGVIPFVADPATVFAEVARVLRPGGRFAFSTSHPIRWAFPDDPGQGGLTVTQSYFDTRAYVETESGRTAYAEHHRTLGTLLAGVIASGLVLAEVREPEWKESTHGTWGGWSPLRGGLIPGTLIVAADKPA